MRGKLTNLQEQAGVVQQAIRDRDDAIAKYGHCLQYHFPVENILHLLQAYQEMVDMTTMMRDFDVIRRKNLMEAELVRAKNDMMCLNNQLLEAIQRKLELSQELEDWQVGALDVSPPNRIHAFISRGAEIRMKQDQSCVRAELPANAIKLSHKECCGVVVLVRRCGFFCLFFSALAAGLVSRDTCQFL